MLKFFPLVPHSAAFALAACALLAGCGGGSSDGPSLCADNPTAPIDSSIAELKQYYGGLTLNGLTCRPQCIYGGVLTILGDGSGGTLNGTIFAISRVCKNAASPDTLFVSGAWPDGSKFLNASFFWQTTKVRYMTIPSSTYYFYMP